MEIFPGARLKSETESDYKAFDFEEMARIEDSEKLAKFVFEILKAQKELVFLTEGGLNRYSLEEDGKFDENTAKQLARIYTELYFDQMRKEGLEDLEEKKDLAQDIFEALRILIEEHKND